MYASYGSQFRLGGEGGGIGGAGGEGGIGGGGETGMIRTGQSQGEVPELKKLRPLRLLIDSERVIIPKFGLFPGVFQPLPKRTRFAMAGSVM